MSVCAHVNVCERGREEEEKGERGREEVYLIQRI